MVCGFIQHQKVWLCQQETGQKKAGTFATGKRFNGKLILFLGKPQAVQNADNHAFPGIATGILILCKETIILI